MKKFMSSIGLNMKAGGASSSAPKPPPPKVAAPSPIEVKMVKAMRDRAASKKKTTIKSFDSIIMKFPKIDATFEKVRETFKRFDKDGSGTIDLDELKECFRQLQVSFTDEEVKAFHEESDMDASKGVDFKEFIVVLALVYLLGETKQANSKSRIGLPELEATFDNIADTYIFFDKDKDGYVGKSELISAMDEFSSGRQGNDSVGIQRFQEMDWNKDGSITFKEFLFAFTDWVGVKDDEDEED